MGSLAPRPSFVLDLPGDAQQAIARLRAALQTPELRGLADSASQCVDFKIERSERRFWSPHLSAQVSQTPDGAKLYARFSPRPEVWTMFIAVYFSAALVMAAAAIYGYVQWTLGESPSALLLIPLGAVLIASLHVVSLVGQGWSRDQMHVLRARLDRAVEIAFGGDPRRGVESSCSTARSPAG